MQLNNMLKLKAAWLSADAPESAIVLSSRVRLARNLERHAFPGKARAKDLSQVIGEIFEGTRKNRIFGKAAFLRLEDLDDLDRGLLVERHLISKDLTAEPANRGVVVGEKEKISLMINEEDHLRMQSLEAGLSLSAAWEALRRLDDELGQRLNFAYDPDWGFLTACPTNLGTGLRASCLLHLPALGWSSSVNRVLESLSRMGVIVRGLYGEGTRVLGDIFQLSNATCLGRTEEAFIDRLKDVVERLVEREKEERQRLCSGPERVKLEDSVYRSVGILSHCRIITFEEAMHHLSYIRLGIALGWAMPMGLPQLNDIFLTAQPAHIQMAAQKELAARERDQFRAEKIRGQIGA
ncbi:MAG: protein arginine kinase [Elusimicrobia bacterium]|nr:protein arginine kinase [Elusimicrobiota bacterium]